MVAERGSWKGQHQALLNLRIVSYLKASVLVGAGTSMIRFEMNQVIACNRKRLISVPHEGKTHECSFGNHHSSRKVSSCYQTWHFIQILTQHWRRTAFNSVELYLKEVSVTVLGASDLPSFYLLIRSFHDLERSKIELPEVDQELTSKRTALVLFRWGPMHTWADFKPRVLVWIIWTKNVNLPLYSKSRPKMETYPT